jgi:acetoin:2,6-dichlorophenolindophenol oxidoreductase subunit beta
MQMSYSATMNESLLSGLSGGGPILAFGQNIGAGSYLSGLTRGIIDVEGCTVLNTPNCENAQVGFGFGLMLEGTNGIFIVKQQDFLLLCLDQLVNTANIVTRGMPNGSFTVAFVTVDSGFEGPQSRLNNFAEICALSAQPGYTITSQQEAELILNAQIGAPGFRMIGFSQRLFREPAIDIPDAQLLDSDTGTMRYREGSDLAIVACNFALPQALQLATELSVSKGLSCAVISVPRVDSVSSPTLSTVIMESSKAVVLDDSHSKCGSGRAVATFLQAEGADVTLFDRSCETRDVSPNADRFEVTMEDMAMSLGL